MDLGQRADGPRRHRVAGRRAITGTAQQLLDQLGQYADLGFDEFILADWNLGASKAERSDNLARIKAEVLDRLPA